MRGAEHIYLLRVKGMKAPPTVDPFSLATSHTSRYQWRVAIEGEERLFTNVHGVCGSCQIAGLEED